MASRLRIVLTIGLLAISGYLASNLWAHWTQVPRLEISPEFDVGELAHDEELDLSIGFGNAGSAVLRMEPPIPGCKCRLAELSRAEFAPGEQGTFRVKLRPARPAGTDYSQEIVVPSNDPIAPRRIVTIRGRMRGSLAAYPAALRATMLAVGEPWSRDLTISCTDAHAKFAITSVTSDLTSLEFGVAPPWEEPTGDAGLSYTIRVDRRGSQAVGLEAGQILVRTDHPIYKELRIEAAFDVRSSLSFEPASLLFDLSRTGGPQRVLVTAPRQVTLVPEKHEQFAVDLEQKNDGKAWLITVSPNSHSGQTPTLRSHIRLLVSGLPGETELHIPVTVIPQVIQPSDMP